MARFAVLLVNIFLVISCARAPIKSVDQAMRPTKTPEILYDDLDLVDLKSALDADIARIKTYNAPLDILKFGPEIISKDVYIAALTDLANSLTLDVTGQIFYKKLREEFEFFEVYGDESWGDVFITSYYEPVIQGRLKKKKPYTQPLYTVPTDMVLVDMNEFTKAFSALKPIQDVVTEKARDGMLRGRQVATRDAASGDVSPTKVVPYFSREEIDTQNVLKNTAKIICYVEPVDAFFLQIQGSGRVQLPGGEEIRVGYAAQNGHPYKAIGKALFDIIPKEQMTAQKIESHLRSLSSQEAQKLMSINPSYVFFKKQETLPLSFFGAEVVTGRTIATDQKYFPKGALAYLEYEKPEFVSSETNDVKEFKKTSRFVLDQDAGGAIRGPHRVDLFWGRGPEAAKVSGVMRNRGRLYYILPKVRAL
jgi:membrane-bound lytic murein transglycosylase A